MIRDDGATVSIDGVPIDAMTQDEVVELVLGAIEQHADGGVIITANADIMRQLRAPAQDRLAERARLIVADGMPLVWASRLMASALPERVNGTNLLWRLCEMGAGRRCRVFLLGAAPGVGADAARAFRARIPGLEICGVASPPMGFERDAVEWERIRTEVEVATPDVVFVALGHPRQEEVGLRLAGDLPRTWFIGCGGALDLVAGHIARAPVVLQRIGAEWLYRLVQEPRRLVGRYLVHDVPYVVGMLFRAWRLGTHRRR